MLRERRPFLHQPRRTLRLRWVVCLLPPLFGCPACRLPLPVCLSSRYSASLGSGNLGTLACVDPSFPALRPLRGGSPGDPGYAEGRERGLEEPPGFWGRRPGPGGRWVSYRVERDLDGVLWPVRSRCFHLQEGSGFLLIWAPGVTVGFVVAFVVGVGKLAGGPVARGRGRASRSPFRARTAFPPRASGACRRPGGPTGVPPGC